RWRRSRRPLGSRDGFLVDAVGLVAPGAGLLGRLVDVAVVLEDPRELRAPVPGAANLSMELEEQERVDAERAVFRDDAEEQEAHLIDDPLASEQSDQAEWKQPAAGSFERLVDVGQRDRARDRP